MTRLFACFESTLPVGSAIRITGPSGALALINSCGTVYALDDRCSHGNASLSDGYVDDDGTVECPLHSARFCLRTGAPLCQPATAPLSIYPVVADAGALYIELPESAR